MSKKQNSTDSKLILEYLEGNTTVMPILVKRYHKLFCEKAYWVTKHKESAKDVAQESWVVIIDKLHTLERVDSFKAWALRIVYTKAIDAVKSRSKLNINQSETDLTAIENANQDSNPRQTLLIRAIRQLPKQKADIIRLYYTEEYSVREISSFLDIPIGTVKSRLFKAREQLKSLLKSSYYEE